MADQKPTGNEAVENGKDDAGESEADRDILGKRQEDLTAEDLEGDTRESGTE